MNIKSLIAASAMSLVLSACGDTGTFPPADGGNGGSGSISVLTSAGGGDSIVLQGTYSSACYNSGIDSHTINGTTITISVTAYDTANCSGTGTESILMTATLSVGSAGTGPWVNGMDELTQAPMAADGQNLLPELPAFTRLNLTFIGGANGPTLYYVVDTSGTSPILYRSNDNVLNSVSIADPLTLLQ